MESRRRAHFGPRDCVTMKLVAAVFLWAAAIAATEANEQHALAPTLGDAADGHNLASKPSQIAADDRILGVVTTSCMLTEEDYRGTVTDAALARNPPQFATLMAQRVYGGWDKEGPAAQLARNRERLARLGLA